MNRLFRLLVVLFCSLALAVVGVVIGVLMGMTRIPGRPAEADANAFGPWMGDVLDVAIVGFLGGILGLVAGTAVGWLVSPRTDRRPGISAGLHRGLRGIGPQVQPLDYRYVTKQVPPRPLPVPKLDPLEPQGTSRS